MHVAREGPRTVLAVLAHIRYTMARPSLLNPGLRSVGTWWLEHLVPTPFLCQAIVPFQRLTRNLAISQSDACPRIWRDLSLLSAHAEQNRPHWAAISQAVTMRDRRFPQAVNHLEPTKARRMAP